MYILKAIKTEKDYTAALSRMEKIFDAKPGSKEGNEAEVLIILIADYERNHYRIEAPSPVEAIKFRMEQLNFLQKELAPYLGSATRVSEVLNGKRQLTLAMIAALHKGLNIPLASLLQAANKAKKSSLNPLPQQQLKISVAGELKTRYRRKKKR